MSGLLDSLDVKSKLPHFVLTLFQDRFLALNISEQ